MMHYTKTLAMSLVVGTLLSGCSVESESWVNTQRAEVHDDQFTDTLETDKIDGGIIQAVSEYYYRYGNGPLEATVSFDPASKVNTKAKAERAASKLKQALAAKGVRQSHISVTASPATGDVSKTLISFPAITANAPQGCGTIPGYAQPNDIQNNANDAPQYKFGCTVETLMARQIARPSDLLGKQGFDSAGDGRRQERVISTRGYYGDKPNDSLKGETSSSK